MSATTLRRTDPRGHRRRARAPPHRPLAVLLRRRRPVAGHPPRPRPLHHEVLSATQWAHAGTALALWMLLPLLIGIWRITRQEVAA
jgi:hypothetical protein